VAEQAIDMRSFFSNFRHHRTAVAVAVLLGAGAGAGLVVAMPPQYSSQSLVLLPPVQAADSGGQPTGRNSATEVKVASSDAVLGPAGAKMTPRMSTRDVKKTVEISAPTNDVIQVEAYAGTAAQAEMLARSIAESEVEYLTKSSSSQTAAEVKALSERHSALQDSLTTVNAEIEKAKARQQGEGLNSADSIALAQLTAQQADLVLKIDDVKSKERGEDTGPGAAIIQSASPARRPGLVPRLALSVGIGVLLALAVLGVLLGAMRSRDRRMRMRDEIADAIGGAVVASLRSQPQRSAAGWVSMLADYAPSSVDVLALRQMLRQLAPDESVERARQVEVGEHRIVHPTSITVISLAGDERALAVGPQIASFAASVGIRTRLVAGRSHESAAALFAACTPQRAGEEIRPNLLLDTRSKRDKADFTVVIAVVDRDDPDLSHVQRSAVTVLAVASGAATAEELARAAVVADESGRLVSGIVVADPDESDRTTGRMLQHERAQQVALPSRLTGVRPPKSSDGKITGLGGGAS
jgi:capsular polysaccharide biosynthesis protein